MMKVEGKSQWLKHEKKVKKWWILDIDNSFEKFGHEGKERNRTIKGEDFLKIY